MQKFYINCPTEREYLITIEILKDFGYNELSKDYYIRYEKNTAVGFNINSNRSACYCNFYYFMEEKSTLIPNLKKLIYLLQTGKLSNKLKLG